MRSAREVRSAGAPGEQAGAFLILLMIGVTVGMIMLGAVAQSWTTALRRDREEELIFRGGQYVDAILAYRKEHGGQFPTRLEQLYEEGPRRLRYIRKLYGDPISVDGRWGLLYLMPGGRGVYDPRAPQGHPAVPGGVPGVMLLNPDPTGSGVPGTSGPVPGAPPPGPALPLATPPPPRSGSGGERESISEPPLGWPIVGVVSRATGREDDSTFRIYKGHDDVRAWQFHVFDRGLRLPTSPGSPAQAVPRPGIGPGFGGKSPISGLGGGPTPNRRNLFPGRRGRQPGRGLNLPGRGITPGAGRERGQVPGQFRDKPKP
ncbi:MAG: hypothetical protein ACE5JH_02470 [Acidobacteriota bacterium]